MSEPESQLTATLETAPGQDPTLAVKKYAIPSCPAQFTAIGELPNDTATGDPFIRSSQGKELVSMAPVTKTVTLMFGSEHVAPVGPPVTLPLSSIHWSVKSEEQSGRYWFNAIKV